ncbi:MAG: peptidylprolyl isomerase [Marinicellaceae bacterium]
MNIKLLSILLLTICLISCNQQQNTPEINTSNTLAKLNEVSVTKQDVKEYLLTLPSDARWSNTNQEEWLTNIIKSLAINKVLLTEAKNANIENHVNYIEAVNKIERNFYSNQFLFENEINIDIDQESIELYYKNNINKYQLPEKRIVHHIFKSYKGNKENAISELNTIRNRSLNGENFILLAEENSDSESRHNSGIVGTVKKGDLSKDFDEIIFNLEKNKPSEIIKTAEGAHIFMVFNILKEKFYSIEEVTAKIKKQLFTEKSIEAIKEIALTLPESENYYLISLEDLKNINTNTSKNHLLFQLGEFELRRNQFMNELAEARDAYLGTNIINLPYLVLQDISYRQIIYTHVMNNLTQINIPDNALEKVKITKEKELLEIYSKLKLVSYVNENPEIITKYFNENEMRFSSPVILDLQLLKLPKEGNSNIMPILESLSDKLNNGELSFKELKNQYNGDIINLGKRTVFQLYQIDSKVLKQVLELKIGEYSKPYTVRNSFHMVQLKDRINAKKRPLLEVRNQVVNQYIKDNASYLFTKISDKILEGIEINKNATELFLKSIE